MSVSGLPKISLLGRPTSLIQVLLCARVPADSPKDNRGFAKESDVPKSAAPQLQSKPKGVFGAAEPPMSVSALPSPQANAKEATESQCSPRLDRARRTAPHEKRFKEALRNKVCQELVDTERRFCSCLWTLIDLIAESIKASSCVPIKELCQIFPR